MSLVEYYWRGNGPLRKIFWIYGVVVSVGLAALIATAAFQKWVGFAGLVAMLVGLVSIPPGLLSAFGAAPTTLRGVPSVLTQPCGVRCRERLPWRGLSTPLASHRYSLR
jgi:hypothetical protein